MDDNEELVVQGLYEKAYGDLDRLRTQLSEDAVVTLAREVLDRLAKVRRADPDGRGSIMHLSEALCGNDPSAAARLIGTLHRGGATVEELYLQYLAPASHVLGQWWVTDKITFADVTVGTGRIYAIMRNLARLIPPNALPERKSAFFASVPNDTHTLGVKMAADLSRKQGWDIDLALDSDHDGLLDQFLSSNLSLIGLSAGGIHALPDLARIVMAIRVSAPSALIMVSGNIVNAAAESIELLHVDGASAKLSDAMEQLDVLWGQLQARTVQ